MEQSIYIIHYDLTIGTNTITGNATTITSSPPTTQEEAALTLIRSIQATAPQAIVRVLGAKEIDQAHYDYVVKLFKPI